MWLPFPFPSPPPSTCGRRPDLPNILILRREEERSSCPQSSEQKLLSVVGLSPTALWVMTAAAQDTIFLLQMNKMLIIYLKSLQILCFRDSAVMAQICVCVKLYLLNRLYTFMLNLSKRVGFNSVSVSWSYFRFCDQC